MTTAHSNGYRPQHRLVVVTASADAARLEKFCETLRHYARDRYAPPPVVAVLQTSQEPTRVHTGLLARTPDYLGVVPAFSYGVELALMAYPGADVIACLHDDCLVEHPNWDEIVRRHFDAHPACGLAGFGGAWGLGDEQAGVGEYRPTWLVRRGFMSNMHDAEVHGTRVTEPRQIAVLDGFSLIFRRRFLHGWERLAAKQLGDTIRQSVPGVQVEDFVPDLKPTVHLFSRLQRWGVVHHAYDAAMGAFAKELDWQTWLLPLTVKHLGGQTAVGDARYAEWARYHARRMPDSPAEGDQAFWESAHQIVWKRLGHLLPFEVERP